MFGSIYKHHVTTHTEGIEYISQEYPFFFHSLLSEIDFFQQQTKMVFVAAICFIQQFITPFSTIYNIVPEAIV